jgi:hypothetical protein
VNWLSSCAAIAAASIPTAKTGILFSDPSSLMVRCARRARRVPMMNPMIAAIANANELMVYSCTNSISVPKLPFGCINATVVPRLPGRGALSIAVAPAATIAARASAQLFTRYPM